MKKVLSLVLVIMILTGTCVSAGMYGVNENGDFYDEISKEVLYSNAKSVYRNGIEIYLLTNDGVLLKSPEEEINFEKVREDVTALVTDGYLTSDNKLYMWGSKAYMGIGETEGSTDAPICVMENVEKVWNTLNSYFARKTDGSMWAWGQEGYRTVVKNNGYSMPSYISNRLGIGENEIDGVVHTATRMGIDNICEMKLYSWTTLAKTDNNDLYAWGDTFDQSGFIYSNVPVKIGENVYDFNQEVILLNNGDLVKWNGDVILKNVYHIKDESSGFNSNMVGIYDIYAYCQDRNLYKIENGKATLVTENTILEGVEVKPLVIGVYINGDVLDADTAPYIKQGRTMVPMRAIFEALGASVTWDDTTKTAIAVKDKIEIITVDSVDRLHKTQEEVKITIGENVLCKNGEAIELDCAAEITNGRTMVPVRAISEAFGCTVEWDNETKTVNIIEPYNRLCYIYDKSGHVAGAKDGTGNYLHYEYLYDENGNVVRVWEKPMIKNSDRLFEYTYNEKGQMISKNVCSDWWMDALYGGPIDKDVTFTEVEKYFYDEAGKLLYAEYPSGGRRYYIYDEEDKLIREENDEGKVVKKYVYNEHGRINYTESY